MGRKLILTGPEHKGGDDIYHLTVDDVEGPQALRLTVSAGMLSIGTGRLTELKLPLPEPDGELVDAVFDRAVEALPDRVTLYQAHYSEELSDEHIQRLFAGDEDHSVVDELTDDDGYREATETSRWEVIEEYVNADDVDLLKQANDQIYELHNLIDERDDTDLVRDLARYTGKRFVRYKLGEIELTSMDAEHYDRAASEIAGLLGLDTDSPHMTYIRSILNNADTAWGPRGLWLLFYGDVEELIDACQDPAAKLLSVESPEVVLLDSNTGGGWSEQIHMTVTVPFDRSRLKRDAKGIGNGYSWTEESSGGGAIDATVTFTPAP